MPTSFVETEDEEDQHKKHVVAAVYAGVPLFPNSDTEPGRRGLVMDPFASPDVNVSGPILVSENEEPLSLAVIVAMCLIPFLILVLSAALLTYLKSREHVQDPVSKSSSPGELMIYDAGLIVQDDFAPAWSRPFWCAYIRNQKVTEYSVRHVPRQYCSAFVYGFVQLQSPGQLEDVTPYKGDVTLLKNTAKINKGQSRPVYLAVGGPSATDHIKDTVKVDKHRDTFCVGLLDALKQYNLDGAVIHFEATLLDNNLISAAFASHISTCFSAHGKTLVLVVPSQSAKRQQYFPFIDASYNVSVIFWTHHIVDPADTVSQCPVDLKMIDDFEKHSMPQPSGHSKPTPQYLITLSLSAGRFRLSNSNNPGSLQAVVAGSPETVRYTEVCRGEKLQWQRKLNSDTGCIEIWKGDVWMSSLDGASDKAICHTLSTGIAIFDMEYDDFLGTCDGNKHPLMRAVARGVAMVESAGKPCDPPRLHRLFDR
ncbi:uncharacterized protein LOC135388314 isoform X3 [Ornithodoros turicata]|uniref:uncharacterized protein LOC135388314 isoform X3 n=1 Tax=Ornithodoros turicata TaxID=34597 RepID=UPI00313A3381